MADPRIEALSECANDDNEYSGWVQLARGALDVIAEAEAEVERLDRKLRGANLRLEETEARLTRLLEVVREHRKQNPSIVEPTSCSKPEEEA